ncbi:MAG: glycosyltransferase [Actinobacteria bacterium]|nr:glycosyltransferase [Actinomycetota bacterium]
MADSTRRRARTDTPPRSLRAGTVAAGALLAHTVVNASLLRRARSDRAHPPARRVSVLVPARNEADRIGGCIASLLAVEWDDLEVLVLDDESDDGTAAAVARLAGGDPRLRVLHGGPRPEGWLGKPWACAQLADAADGDVLVFVDADVTLAPQAVAATVGLLDDGLDLACPYPRQIAEGLLARLVQPLLQWSWLTFLPLRVAERSPRPTLTAANGQLMACTAATYRKAGGHAAVRDQVLDDIAFARVCKRAGLRAGVADGTAIARCRMYRSSDALIAGYTKSLWSAFGTPAGAAGVGALLWWLYIRPVTALPTALARRDRAVVRTAVLGYGLGVAGRVIAAVQTGGRPLDAAAHPLSVAALLWLTARSVIGHRRGTLAWRGRPVMAGPAERRGRRRPT